MYITMPLAFALAAAGAYMVASSNGVFEPAEPTGPKHPVTPEMQAGVDQMMAQRAPTFALKDPKGKEWDLAKKTKDKPAFVYFVLDGCPCSIDAEPLFHKLYERFKGKIEFAGAMPNAAEAAERWKVDMKTPYDVLLDPEAKVALSYGAERSVYCALVAPGGNIDKMWAGYSESMLQDVNERMAKLLKEEVKTFDAAYAPKELSSGCSLTEGVGK